MNRELDSDESAEVHQELSDLRDKIREQWKACTDPEKAFALKHVGIAAKKLCDQINQQGKVHEETLDTVRTRSEILLAF
jgi:hypothetical protein